MPPFTILIGAAILLLFFLRQGGQAPVQAVRRQAPPPQDEGPLSFLGDAQQWLARGGQALAAGGTLVTVGQKAISGLSGLLGSGQTAQTAAVVTEVTTEIATPVIEAGLAAAAELAAPSFVIADIAALEAGFELGAGVAELAAVETGTAALAGDAAAVAPAAGGTIGGALTFVVAPVAILFGILSFTDMLQEKEQAKRRSRRAGDANDFVVSVIGKLERATVEGFDVLHEEAHPGTGITAGSAITAAGLLLHNHAAGPILFDLSWSPTFAAVAGQLNALGHQHQYTLTLRDVNSVKEAMFVTGGESGAVTDMEARYRAWKSIFKFLDDAFTQVFGERYLTLRSTITEPYVPRPAGPPILGYGGVETFYYHYFGLVDAGHHPTEAERIANSTMGYIWTVGRGYVASEPYVPQLF